MLEISFQQILGSALTPITLISGVGLMMLCMTNRYNHATDRIRKLIHKRELTGNKHEPVIDDEIRLVYKRALFLRHAMMSICLSMVSSGLLVATNVLSHFLTTDLTSLASLWLFAATGLIVLSSIFFFIEVITSLRALGSAIKRLPGKKHKYARFY